MEKYFLNNTWNVEKNMDGFNYNKIKDCVPSRNSKKKLDKEVKKTNGRYLYHFESNKINI